MVFWGQDLAEERLESTFSHVFFHQQKHDQMTLFNAMKKEATLPFSGSVPGWVPAVQQSGLFA